MLLFETKANLLKNWGNYWKRKPIKIVLKVNNYVKVLIRLRGSDPRLKKIKSKIFKKIKLVKESKNS